MVPPLRGPDGAMGAQAHVDALAGSAARCACGGAVPVGKSLVEIEQGRHRRVPRADRCCPIEGCGRLVEDEGHLMECPLYFNPENNPEPERAF